MSPPIKKPNPTITDVLIELSHIQSSLSMPQPATTLPEDVSHAFEHLMNCVEMVTVLARPPHPTPDSERTKHVEFILSVLRHPLALLSGDRHHALELAAQHQITVAELLIAAAERARKA